MALILSPLGAVCPVPNETSGFFEAHIGLWNFLSLVPAILSIFVSGIGLFLIWAQLKASRQTITESSRSAQAAADAARISFAATRPWIKLNVKKAHLFFCTENPQQVGCQVDYRIENLGNTPALATAVLFKPLPSGQGINVDIHHELKGLLTMKPNNPRVLFPNDSVEEALSINFDFPNQINEEMLGFKLIVAAVYKTVPDGETYWTPAVFQLQHEAAPKDGVYRFYRGMGTVPCLVIHLGDDTLPPT